MRPLKLFGIYAGIIAVCLSSEFASAQVPDPLTDSQAAPVVYTPTTSTLTMEMAFEAAERYNPRIQAAQQRHAISETDIRLARTGHLPVIDATASYGYLYQDNKFTLAPESNISGQTSNLGLGLRQPLYNGNRVKNAIKGATANASAAEARIAAERQQIYLEVATAYLDVQRDISILRLTTESLETLEEQLRANEKRYEFKDTSLTDVARSRSAVATARTQIATARASFAVSRAVFFRLTGLPGERLADVSSVPGLPNTVEAALIRALDDNASVAAARLTLEASEFAVKEAKGQRLPSVSFNSSVNRGRRPENFGIFSDDRTTTALSANVSLTVPIFQADQEFGNIKRAKQIRGLREIEVTQALRDVRDNITITWDKLQATKAALSFHNDAVVAAESAAEGTRKIYRSGLVSAIDLTETERILLQTKTARERAKHEYHVIAYQLLALTNGISP